MFKRKLKSQSRFSGALFATLLAAGIVTSSLSAQTQLRGWHCAPKTINFTTATPSLPAGTFSPVTAAGRAFNSIYDSEKKLLFYIAGNYTNPTIYNKFNSALYTLPTANVSENKEIWIVPSPANDGCTAKYYVIYGKVQVIGTCPCGPVQLAYVVVDMAANDGLGAVSAETLILNAPPGGVSSPEPSVAVSDLVGGSYYNMYIAFGNAISYTQITASGIATASSIYTNALVTFNAEELELSDNGGRLAWTETGTSTGKIYVVDVSGTTISNLKTFTALTNATNVNVHRGLEFDKTGNYLYYTDYTQINQIGDLNLPTQTHAAVPGTTGYKSCMLEKSYNGNEIIMANATTISSIITPTGTGGMATVSSWTISFGLPNVHPMGGFAFYGMPKQIDGRNYDNQATVNIDLSDFTVNSAATWTPTSNPVISNPAYVNSYLGSGSYPVNPIRVRGFIQQTTGAHLDLYDLHFQFKTNAEWRVNGGANLKLYGDLLEGDPCGLMWKGIAVNYDLTPSSPCTMLMQNDGSIYSIIYDAIKGIRTEGPNVTLTIQGYTLFNKNEKHVVINGGNGSLITIKGSQFNHTLQLKDQSGTYGQQINGSGPYFGKYGVEVNNSAGTTPVTVGVIFSPNTFTSGQVGVHAYASNVTVQYGNFYNADHAAVDGDGAWLGKTLAMLDNTCSGNRTNLWAAFGYNVVAQRNQFNYTTEFGIRWHYNYGCSLLIGDGSPVNGNSFNNWGWGAIVATDAENPSTVISINSNTFANAPWAGTIQVSEPSLTSAARTYSSYYVGNNTFTNVGEAVYVTNIKGVAAFGPTDDIVTIPRFDVGNNTISYSTAYNGGAMGIRMVNCIQNRILFNTVNSDAWTNSWNIGIMVDNSQSCLVKGNYSKAGQGIRLGLDMTNSNVLCNTLDQCAIGINLNWCWLRASGQYHGTPSTSGRQNTFTGCTTDIQVFNSNPALNQWVSPNTTNITYVGVTGSIVGPSGTSPCGGSTRLAGPGAAQEEGGESTALNENGEHDFTLFPNPAHDKFTFVKNGEENKTGTIEVTDMEGRVIYHGEMTGNKTEIDLSGQDRGVYFVRYQSDQLLKVFRLVLN